MYKYCIVLRFDCLLFLDGGLDVRMAYAVLCQRKADDIEQPDDAEEEAGKEIPAIAFLMRELRCEDAKDNQRNQPYRAADPWVTNDEFLYLIHDEIRIHKPSPFPRYLYYIRITDVGQWFSRAGRVRAKLRLVQ